MKRILLSLGAAVGLMVLPAALEAQVPVVLVCQDGTTQPGSSRVGCGDHGGMDWEATRVWSEMRAGQYAAADTVVCTDGQNRAAGPRACADHGGVDSVSTYRRDQEPGEGASLRRPSRSERAHLQAGRDRGWCRAGHGEQSVAGHAGGFHEVGLSGEQEPGGTEPARIPGNGARDRDLSARFDA